MSKSAKSRKNQRYRERFTTPLAQHFAIANELLKIYKGLIKQGTIGTSIKISKFFLVDSGLEAPWSEKRLMDLFGDIVLDCFNELGPVYGKAAQIALSRAEGEARNMAEKFHLDRLYHDWPPMQFSEVEAILDEEIPDWQQEFIVEPHPLGVASMAQVHTAIDDTGKKWVIKVIKPQSDARLHETLDAIEQMLTLARPLEYTSVGRRTVKELRSLVSSMRLETDLAIEKRNIDRMRERLAAKKQKVLRLPETLDSFCSPRVMTVEKFEGVSLADVVSGHAELNKEQRKKLAKKVLHEMMVQVFEIGLFHGDPHAGNLILMDDGTVGLFDWGLTGELEDSDRRHISAMLRSLMTWDMERLIDALGDIARDGGVEVAREDIEAEVRNIATFVNEKKEQGKKATLQEMLEVCLNSAGTLEIPVPDGLLMMVKSLVTVEGLARGIDPQVSMGRIATPLLFKVAKPDVKDLLAFSKRLPKFAGQFLNRA
ncbi:ABC1 kinase family protein [Pseudobacteriovorax antillogorgiicola]|uniref:Predicted unusual protein kinase regulating ubiquinone biosynthesis, AarF/ABC1/UbiB family n=1 Tax=Pseudobacteriovorax antillogorgiicola TaxID=1513793 RepID=A0A1Y6CQK5_9BACT|nr:AarF/UbiB family protein [Pseudobacteriovorax antillogorgiicola]TCS45888.1 putative unusual protein kinase regulating ubiquinone biosynthesis (AarF/ABC1/UbiB family) [Pseudobacteriovorax antillogorgiicola]SMF71183.1 Predicted unusual protein kinase regulating ubiquinone biosynthesis, AarF/ABC1/UbiB family [Pseudobacteriovorax antillogorgiicola]